MANSTLSIGSQSQVSKFAGEERIVTSGVTLNDGDFTSLASGALILAVTGAKLYGVVRGGESSSLVSRTYRAPTIVGDGTKTCLIEFVNGQRFNLPVSAALASDAEGKYYSITGATNAQQVDNTSKSATIGQFICLKRIADSTGAFTRGIFMIAAPQTGTTPV